jgi:predicted unusual protein kinase regulating ubiquinone biosynthesis (AarF/ABC1/UbiB family)
MLTGPWSRSRSVLALAAGVAGKELKLRVRSQFASSADALGLSEVRTRIEQARLIAESLGRLKGAFMKAGQLLSIDSSDILPPEAVEILAKLQGQAEPVDFAIIRAVLESELGTEGLASLQSLDPVPAASASIGQVHRAVAFGEPVAVKVQYPGIAESIDSDIALLENLGTSWLTLSRRDIDVSGTFEELRRILHFEADYVRERMYLERFGELLGGDERFAVPRSVAALSSARVLTMGWAEGVPLGDWIRSRPSRPSRELFARAVLDLYCKEFFDWGLVQTDPNFGNFLVRPMDNRIVLLDFGATVEYANAFRTGYVALLHAVASGDRGRIVDGGIGFGLIDSRESKETREFFTDMLLSSVEPFAPSRQPFVFRDPDYLARSTGVTQRFIRSLSFSPPPRGLIFLHRKLGGIFHLLRRLDVELDLGPYWEKMVAAEFEEKATKET